MTQMDIMFSTASLKTKEGRRIYMRCLKMFPGHIRYILAKDANFTPLNVTNDWGKVGKYKTKSFGKIDLSNITKIFGVDIKHYRHRINLHFYGDFINQKIIDACLYTINNYFDINSAVKQKMLIAFQNNKYLNSFFKHCYYYFPRYESIKIFGKEEFKMINLKNAVKKLKYPDLMFKVENNNLTIVFCYHFNSNSSSARSTALYVSMNEQLNILNFEYGEHLLS